MISSHAKSHTIRAGLSLVRRDHAASSENAARASAANASKADRRAADLRVLVERELATMPTGGILSPSVLARRLNEKGIAAPRGGAWSHNSAKNLLHRLRLPDEPARD